jgi:hypothetical protein
MIENWNCMSSLSTGTYTPFPKKSDSGQDSKFIGCNKEKGGTVRVTCWHYRGHNLKKKKMDPEWDILQHRYFFFAFMNPGVFWILTGYLMI